MPRVRPFRLAHSPARRAVFARQARARFADGERSLKPYAKRAIDEYLAALRKQFASSHLTAAAAPKKKPTPASAPADFGVDDVGDWIDQLTAQGVFENILDSTLMPAIASTVDGVLSAGLNRPDTSDRLTAWRNDWLAQRRQELVNIPDDVTGQLRTALSDLAAKQGTNVADAADAVQTMLDEGYPSWDGRANLIARTETVGANNQGSLAQALAIADADQLTGRKTWLSTSDNRTRPDHADADGQTVGLDENFTVGGVEMNGPGDNSGGADQVCNCRCTLTYEYDPPSSTDGDNTGDNDGAEPDDNGDLTAAADTAQPTGVAVMAALAADDAARLAVAGGEAPDQMHVTLGYLGQPATSYTPEQRQSLIDALTLTAATVLPFTADAFATAHFNPEDEEREPCAVVLVQSDDLAAAHDAICGAIEQAGLDLSTTFPIWVPHVTVAYNADPSVIPEGVVGGPLAFDRIDIGWAGEHTTIGAAVDRAGDDAPDGPTTGDFAVTAPTAPAPAPAAPASSTPEATGGDTAAPTAPEGALEPSGLTWSGPLAILDTPSSDGRIIASTGGTIRPLPQPLNWQRESDIGHDGSTVVGRILACEVRGPVLWGSGDWLDPNLNFDTGQAMAQVDAGLGFVSVDLAVQAIGFRDATTLQPVDPALADPVGDVLPEALEWEFGGATICSFAAFADARITNDPLPEDAGEPGPLVPIGDPFMDTFAAANPEKAMIAEDGNSVALPDGSTAAIGDPIAWTGADGTTATGTITAITATDSTVTVTPDPAADGTQPADMTVDVATLIPVPADSGKDGMDGTDAEAALLASSEVRPYNASFFAKRELAGPTPLTVVPETGEVYGHLATFDECHLGKLMEGKCVTAPKAPDGDYSYFHLSEIQTDKGLLSVGKITLGAGHASRGGMSYALSHYDNSATSASVVRAYEDDYGIQVAGQVIHDTPAATVEELMRSPLSGDWRKVDGQFRLVAALAVNSPGFPVRRGPVIGMSGDEQISLVAAGVLDRTTMGILDEIVLPSNRSIPRGDFEALVAAAMEAVERRPKVQTISDGDALALTRVRLSLRGSRHRALSRG